MLFKYASTHEMLVEFWYEMSSSLDVCTHSQLKARIELCHVTWRELKHSNFVIEFCQTCNLLFQLYE